MAPGSHARLGASSSKRWMNCPGSVALSEGIPDTTSSYAQEGTAAHEVVEMVLAQRLRLQGGHAYDHIGEAIPVGTDDEGNEVFVVATAEMLTAAQVMIDHVWERYEALDELDEDVEIYLERRFDLSPLNPPELMFGTADVTLWAPNLRHLEVIDYKHGQGVIVEVEENSQVMMYGLGATVAQGTIPDTIRVTIVQPRVEHPDGAARSYEFDRARLIAFKNELFEAARATQADDAPLAVGDWCRFCRAKAVCPAQKQFAVEVATVEFDVLPEEELAAALPAPALLTPTEVANIVARAGIVMDWLRDVESHALTTLEQGGEIPGYKLIEGRSNRRWRDDDAAEQYLARQGLKKTERNTLTVISPAQAEKKMKALGKDPAKLERFWEKPQGKAKLAPVSDPRPEIATSADADFFPTDN